MKLISVMTPCFNEEENVEAVYLATKEVFEEIGDYAYEHIFIDNASSDNTVPILKKIAAHDKNVKIIVNEQNYGWIRSPFHGLMQGKGDAVISMSADLQDPPETIKEFVEKWEEGYKIVVAKKVKSRENPVMFLIRKLYYYIVGRLSETNQISDFTGFGLYDRKFMDVLRELDDPYPYFRGLVSELGFQIASVDYVQPRRERGEAKNNLYSLYDVAMLGIVSYSRVPLRMAAFLGFIFGFLSLFVAVLYFIYKLAFWDDFQLGLAPMVIGLFFFSSVQLFFIGIVGEYIGSIFTYIRKRPLVIEKERINFD